METLLEAAAAEGVMLDLEGIGMKDLGGVKALALHGGMLLAAAPLTGVITAFAAAPPGPGGGGGGGGGWRVVGSLRDKRMVGLSALALEGDILAAVAGDSGTLLLMRITGAPGVLAERLSGREVHRGASEPAGGGATPPAAEWALPREEL